jgi:hypothetical protein
LIGFLRTHHHLPWFLKAGSFSVFVTVIFSLAWLCGAQAQAQVGLYQKHDITVTNTKSYNNKFDFNVVTLTGRFTSPTGRVVNVTGFYDGDGVGGQNGAVWKIRFMPDEVGVWIYSYTWSDGTAGGNGTLTVTSSANKGPLKLDTANPHHMIHANGEHFFWNGDTEWCLFQDSKTQQDRFQAIDFLHSKRVNNLFALMVNDDGCEVYPWPARDDKTHFSLSKMRNYEAVIEYMQARGMIFDWWFYSDDSQSLLPAANSSEETLYFRYIIARFAAYSNITWNLALEFDEYRSNSWVMSRASFVKAEDPYDHLLSVHQSDGPTYLFPGNPHLDHVTLQRLPANHDVLNPEIIANRNLTASNGRRIPVMNEEFFIEGEFGDVNNFRAAIWAIVMGGGYYKAASLGWWIGVPYQNAAHFTYSKILYEFMTTLPYWELIPSNNLKVSGATAYISAKTGSQYLAYLPDGGTVTLNLTGANGTFNVEWLNPRTGSVTGMTTVTGGANRSFTAPSSGNLTDWLLHISSGGGTPPDLIPPAAPTGLRTS